MYFVYTQTFLGIRVEKDLQRKQKDRKGRRENFGDIKMTKTQQYGKLCSPFQALSVPVSILTYIFFFLSEGILPLFNNAC